MTKSKHLNPQKSFTVPDTDSLKSSRVTLEEITLSLNKHILKRWLDHVNPNRLLVWFSSRVESMRLFYYYYFLFIVSLS